MRFTIIIPTFNEEEIIKKTIINLEKFIQKYLKDVEIIITDGCSSDRTIDKVKKLQKRFSNIKLIKNYEHIGKGSDIGEAIKKSKSSFCIFMDADLSTELSYLSRLLFYLEEGYDIVIGSRLMKESVVDKRKVRGFLSSGYSLLISLLFGVPIKDYQCGFKGFNRTKILPILKEVKNKKWFWDTEVLIRGYKEGLKIKEVPVIWKENRKPKLNIFKVISEMFVSAIRLKLIIWCKSL